MLLCYQICGHVFKVYFDISSRFMINLLPFEKAKGIKKYIGSYESYRDVGIDKNYSE